MSWKLSCPVLRGGESGDARTLPDNRKRKASRWRKLSIEKRSINYQLIQLPIILSNKS